ncbi:hypothetical protein [Nostoc sp. WHI]|uniref:hypothetical protein n=1 Tax=Nostoc sp. WHI TaxID=2650611 RepID=UPI0018C4B108|nr:hypothetical protein [Nostoc sp. WHI]MBG1268116.1 hypothetical protein [Nostoc sp. WHI]
MSDFDGSTGFGLVFQAAHQHFGFNKLRMWCAVNLSSGAAHHYPGLYKLGVWCAGNLGFGLHTTTLVLIS